jgi:hypothetical protein
MAALIFAGVFLAIWGGIIARHLLDRFNIRRAANLLDPTNQFQPVLEGTK